MNNRPLKQFIAALIVYVLLAVACVNSASANCTTLINNFPYNENFESNNGNWITGGFASDWTWGAPAKSIIKTAGSGANCWITGGLKNSSYNDNELSWVQSPCFNFTNLKYPMVSFNANWDTEQNYDGAALQYSTDGGITWQSVGTIGDANNCLNTRWYNTSNISYLNGFTQDNGWSGNNGGAAGWSMAKHTIPFLAGKSTVTFRFIFGAGSKFNSYNGFAFDDFTITEAPANNATFKTVCTANSSVINFQSITDLCPQKYSWDFGDPSAAPNTSGLAAPTHTFSGPGTYTVTLATSGPDNAPFAYSQTVTVLSVAAAITQPINCFASAGEAKATVSGGSNNYSYSWNTTPIQITQTATNLIAGSYTVTVSAPGACDVSAQVTLSQPSALMHVVSITQPSCGVANGTAAVSMSGGVSPYQYNWSPGNQTTASINNVSPGVYIATVTDANGCIDTAHANVTNKNGVQLNVAAINDVSCFNASDGSITTSISGGTAPLTYSWTPAITNQPSASNLKAGDYFIKVTDASGCSDIKTATIHQPLPLTAQVASLATTCGLNNGAIYLSNLQGGTMPYNFTWPAGISATDSANGLSSGNYTVTIADSKGCSSTYNNIIAPSKSLKLTINHTDVSCNNVPNATASAIISDYSGNYTVQWSGPANYSGDDLQNLSAGNYTATASDDAGCSASQSFTITQPSALLVNFTTQPEVCTAANGSINATVTGGVAPYQYLWDVSFNNAPYLNNLAAGNYNLTVSDATDCLVTATASVSNTNPLHISLGADTSICSGNTLMLSPGNFTSYLWQNNATLPTFTVTQQGTYSVKVTDAQNCTATDSITVIEDCGDVFFPSAFTPNGDGLNDAFGPVGNLSLIKDYAFTIYNRWGQIIFQSKDPRQKWNGSIKAISSGTNTFVWIATYTYNQKKNIVKKGTLTLVL